MNNIDGARIDFGVIWQQVESLAPPEHVDGLRDRVRELVRAIDEGGDALADMKTSLANALIDLSMLRDGGDEEGTRLHQCISRLVEVCDREYSRALRNVAAMN